MSDRGEGERVAFIGLGSNLGDRLAYLQAALQELAACPGVRLVRVSSCYETEPVGYREQGWFLNQVAEVATTLNPLELLHVLQGIENKLGRRRLVRWGPRVIDLDLLLFEEEVWDTRELTLPHPRMYERSFVLVPLKEIAPEFRHPDGKTTLRHLQEHLAKGGGEKIRLFRGDSL